MELIDSVNKTLKDDLTVSIQKDSKISIAAACFSIYAFQELKRELKNVDELRFIFTSPTFIKEKAKKEKREFYIPRQTRERSLYGSEFEVKLRNEMTQRAIAKECAEWIRKKATFKSNNNVKISDKLINNLGRCSLDVEMETGTGKTYVYIKTMYELNKYYGWSKFIVVVPSIAIREGVKKSFEITQDHFMEQYHDEETRSW